MPVTADSVWREGQWAALALVGSSLVGHLLPRLPDAVLDALPPWLTLRLAFPLVVLVPVLATAGARAGWRARSLQAGALVGVLASAAATAVVLGMLVLGLALGQPQLLRIGLGWESLRDAALMLLVTTAAGLLLAGVGGVAGALASRLARPGKDLSLSR